MERAAALLGPQASATVCDVTDRAAVHRWTEDIERRFGRIDGLVLAAGEGRTGRLADLSDDDWRCELENKVLSVIHPVRAAHDLLARSDAARVVIIGAITAREPRADLAAVSAARAAQATLSRSLAEEFAEQSILVNCVAVGLVNSPRQEARFAAGGSSAGSYADWLGREATQRGALLGRAATMAEVADLACYLASPRSSYATGAVFDLSGGIARAW